MFIYNYNQKNKIKFNKKRYSIQNNNNIKSLLDKLVNDLDLYLKKFLPDNISNKVALSSKEVFKYYIDHNIEEVILFLKKKKDVYKDTYRVFPSYLDDRQNISKLHERVHKDLLLLSLKDFYNYNIKKYYN